MHDTSVEYMLPIVLGFGDEGPIGFSVRVHRADARNALAAELSQGGDYQL